VPLDLATISNYVTLVETVLFTCRSLSHFRVLESSRERFPNFYTVSPLTKSGLRCTRVKKQREKNLNLYFMDVQLTILSDEGILCLWNNFGCNRLFSFPSFFFKSINNRDKIYSLFYCIAKHYDSYKQGKQFLII